MSNSKHASSASDNPWLLTTTPVNLSSLFFIKSNIICSAESQAALVRLRQADDERFKLIDQLRDSKDETKSVQGKCWITAVLLTEPVLQPNWKQSNTITRSSWIQWLKNWPSNWTRAGSTTRRMWWARRSQPLPLPQRRRSHALACLAGAARKNFTYFHFFSLDSSPFYLACHMHQHSCFHFLSFGNSSIKIQNLKNSLLRLFYFAANLQHADQYRIHVTRLTLSLISLDLLDEHKKTSRLLRTTFKETQPSEQRTETRNHGGFWQIVIHGLDSWFHTQWWSVSIRIIGH